MTTAEEALDWSCSVGCTETVESTETRLTDDSDLIADATSKFCGTAAGRGSGCTYPCGFTKGTRITETRLGDDNDEPDLIDEYLRASVFPRVRVFAEQALQRLRLRLLR